MKKSMIIGKRQMVLAGLVFALAIAVWLNMNYAAKEGGFDAFTSSLFISPYQKHELMRDVGYRAAEEYGVQFYYQDFRPMFRDGQQRARELGFYMQKYCGCIFSEQERYQKPSRIIP